MKVNSSVKCVLLSTCLVLFASAASFAQKVANYSFGKYGTAEYEHFSFWTKAGKRTEVNYTYGKDGKELAAKYLGTGIYKQQKCFKVELTGKCIVYIVPLGTKLQVAALTKNYHNVFNWEYEGPVNGLGTFCDACAEDEKEAINIIKESYLK